VRGFNEPQVGELTPYWLDTATTSGACGPDPDHTWGGQHAAWNGGTNDGFAARMGPSALGYFTRADVPYYWSLADEFTLCDQYFCSVLGPTTPNRLYSMSATIDPAATGGGPVIENLTGPFTWTTYPERLQAAGISWRVYHEADDYDDNPLKFFAQFQNLATTDPLYDAAILNRSADAFMKDAAAGNLPQVSWIVAPMAKSEHPSFPPAVGEDLTASVLGALMGNAELWKKTVFILSYDENGGYYDHVPPPVAPKGTAGEYVGEEPIGLGFRVPTTVVSPWSRGGKVRSEVFDHTSTLLFLEQRFGVEVPNITDWRRSTCGDLTAALDFTSFDPSVPSLPATAEHAAAALQGCATLPAASPPATPVPPTVEP
jgi:phospholipase C